MSLCDGSFFPLSVYPVAIQWLVRGSSRCHAMSLVRSFALGGVGPLDLVHAASLVAPGLAGVTLARRCVAGLRLT